jgi:hypothetical protein
MINLAMNASAGPGGSRAVQASVVATPPLHGRILKGALPFALGGALLALLAAIVAKKLDPRVCSPGDIEDALGLAPIAVLPDFDEVPDSITAECLIRLAAAIEHAGRFGDLQTCIFSGTSRRTGVSTIAERVKVALSTLDRRAVLLHAIGNADIDSPKTESSSALLKQVATLVQLDKESLVLIDTAPLLLSAETERLARSVDGVFVVIQSGVTTRAQLRAAADTLHRLEDAAVGFVLNRVPLAKADPEFRRSLHEMEKHLRNHGASSSIWPVRWQGFVDEPQRKPEHAAQENALPEESVHAEKTADLPSSSTGCESVDVQCEQSSWQRSAPPNQQMPWWLEQPASRDTTEAVATSQTCLAEAAQAEFPDFAPPHFQAPKLPDWFWESGTRGRSHLVQLAAHETGVKTEEMTMDSESRIERLRGLFANVGLANLHRNRGELLFHEQQASPGARPTPSRSVPSASKSSPAEPLIANVTNAVPTPPGKAQPEIFSPKEFVPLGGQKRRSDSVSSAGWNQDEIRILPARRGQYASD